MNLIQASVKPTLAPRTKLGTEKPLSAQANSPNSGKQKEGASFEDVLGKSEVRSERELVPGREARKETAREGQRPDARKEMRNQRDDTSKRGETSSREPKRAEEPAGQRSERAQAKPKSKDGLRLKEDSPKSEDGSNSVVATGVNAPQAKPLPEVKKLEGIESDLPALEGAAQIGSGKTVSIEAPQTAEVDLESIMIPVEGEQAASMQEFVDQMQTQFGINPEKIVEAFSKMSESDLAAPPEVSAQSFIANLGLKGEQKEKATAIYQELLTETALNQNEPQSMQVSVMTSNEDSLNKLNDAIDDLNRLFSGGKTQPELKTDVAAAAGAKAQATPKAPMSTEQLQSQLLARMLTKQNDVAPQLDVGVDGLEGAGKKDSDSGSILDVAGLLAEAGGVALETTGASGDAATDLSNQSGQDSLANAFKEAMQANKGQSTETSKKDEFKVDTRKDTSTDIDLSTAGLPGAIGTVASVQSDDVLTPMQMMPQAPTTKDEQDNVKELMRQAQIVLKNGGGEMNIALKPQGMGTVKLKVSVDDGQVSVQMLTESEQAKRLLEKGLHELKTNLAAENLRVDSLKVDVGAEIKKQMDHNANQDSSREQARQQAMEFMGQFRDERQGFRQGFMESNAWKSYNRGQDRKNVEVDNSTSESSRSKSKSSNSSRLNLVA